MAKQLLTAMKIEKAKPKTARYGLNDGDGLWLFVNPAGKKSWHFIFQQAGEQHRSYLGEYPVFTLQEAREELIKKKRKLAHTDVHSDETFEEAALIWYEGWSAAEKPAPKTQRTLLARLNAHIFPMLGPLKLSEITMKMIVDLLLALRAQDLHATARYVLIDIKRIYRDAITRSACQLNPAESIKASEKLGKYYRGQRPAITKPNELIILIHHIDDLPDTLERCALQLIMIFATRTKELLSARWDEFDLDGYLWCIPAQKMKGREDHVVPLPRQAIPILEQIRMEVDAGEWVFYERGQFNPNLLLTPLYRLGYKGRMCGHGFRSTFATLLREVEKEHKEHIEKQLAHKEPNATVRAYDRSQYLEDRVVMMQKWADYLDSLRVDAA